CRYECSLVLDIFQRCPTRGWLLHVWSWSRCIICSHFARVQCKYPRGLRVQYFHGQSVDIEVNKYGTLCPRFPVLFSGSLEASMGRYIIRRLLQALLLLALLSVGMFALIHLLPGGPEQV